MIKLYSGDCLEIMPKLIQEGVKVDAIIADIPYGTTACKWDSVIPFEPMWDCLHKLVEKNGAICLFGIEPFSSALRMSNIKHYKYDWYWNKVIGGNFLKLKYAPSKNIECISVFCKTSPKYYPIMTEACNIRMNRKLYKKQTGKGILSKVSGGVFKLSKEYDETKRYPKCLLEYNGRAKELNNTKRLHPTQKPVALMEYLIKTYTNEDETVLDFTMGSGTTGVACKNLNRRFIGIEKEEKYFNIAEKRIKQWRLPGVK